MRRCHTYILFVASLILFAPPAVNAAEIFVGPLAGWRNLKTHYGARGDGVSDDTAAIQRALDQLRPETRPYSVLYIPSGTYRITSTLRLPRPTSGEALGISIVGEHPATTRLAWGGALGGTMLDYNAAYARLWRITFDGRTTAGIGLKHGGVFSTRNDYRDLVFRDMNLGIEGGLETEQGIAEVVLTRCRFIGCNTGVKINNWNSLDWWFWNCSFENCGIGVRNAFGNFTMQQSVFRGSRTADMQIHNTSYFGISDNVSIGSRAFLVTTFSTSASCEITLQRNRILDPLDTACIRINNAGPLVMLDNAIRSRAGVTAGPVVSDVGWYGTQGLFVSNTFTVTSPITLKKPARSISPRTVSRTGISTVNPPLPQAPPRQAGPVTELRPGANAALIQAAIDAAADQAGRRPIIHLARGTYNINRTLVIPAGADLQLVGDGFIDQTVLNWTGAGSGPVIHVRGPSKARLAEFLIHGADRADGVQISGCDQPGSRVRLDQAKAHRRNQTGFHIAGLRNTAPELLNAGAEDCAQFGYQVLGVGEGLPCAPVTIYSTNNNNNNLTFNVDLGGWLLVRNAWYETKQQGGSTRFMNLAGSGNLTLHGAMIAHSRAASTAGIEVRGFRGKLSLITARLFPVGSDAGPAMALRSGDARTQVGLIGTFQSGGSPFLVKPAAAAVLCQIKNNRFNNGGQGASLLDSGPIDDATVLSFLRQTRQVGPLTSGAVDTGRADFALDRVSATFARRGFVVIP